MAELEALLLASRSFAQPCCTSGSETIVTTHFAVVQPLEDDDAKQPRGEDGRALSPLTVRPSMASKRRSSVITLDGTSLFADDADMHLAPASADNDTAARTVAGAGAAAQRARSFTSCSRDVSGGGPVLNKSWTEGRRGAMAGSMRRRASAEPGDGDPRGPTGSTGTNAALNVAFSSTRFGSSGIGIGASTSRIARSEPLDFVGRLPSFTYPRRTLPTAAGATRVAPAQPHTAAWPPVLCGSGSEAAGSHTWRGGEPVAQVAATTSPLAFDYVAMGSNRAAHERSGRVLTMIKR
ncbi:hypothetical protein GPECTOR_50g653 [Gonium pectorale]|uniref:Uncharacterized protein n=1 Tax=Gonium pectorale TaxID=33097 RepID=A0A150G7M1_GONPE|nr:hypothetical protein GPECTOR_50g653 [Gonium pectorale]|eukprot:KXZ45859.1 hypothetical protein GPECTOR_50g653 [Gonium pectorale]